MNTTSSEILHCSKNPDNCKPESIEFTNGCVEGNVGPLCEECDTFGELYGKYYTKAI